MENCEKIMAEIVMVEIVEIIVETAVKIGGNHDETRGNDGETSRNGGIHGGNKVETVEIMVETAWKRWKSWWKQHGNGGDGEQAGEYLGTAASLMSA